MSVCPEMFFARRAASLLLLPALVFAGCATWRETRATSQHFAEAWFASLDAGDGDALWEQASELVRKRYEKDFIVKLWLGMREPFGAVARRELDVNWAVDWVYGAPDGEYREVAFVTEYANEEVDVNDAVLLSREDGEWKVLAYSIDRPWPERRWRW